MKQVVTLEGADSLIRELDKFPWKVQERARKSGVSRAATQLARRLRAAAPRDDGTLRRAIGVRRLRSGEAYVGLNKRIALPYESEKRMPLYYKTLDRYSALGSPRNPWFDAAVARNQNLVIDEIADFTRRYLIREAGKIYAKTKARRGR